MPSDENCNTQRRQSSTTAQYPTPSLAMHLTDVILQPVVPMKPPASSCHAPLAKDDLTPKLGLIGSVSGIVVPSELCRTFERFANTLRHVAFEPTSLERGADRLVRVFLRLKGIGKRYFLEEQGLGFHRQLLRRIGRRMPIVYRLYCLASKSGLDDRCCGILRMLRSPCDTGCQAVRTIRVMSIVWFSALTPSTRPYQMLLHQNYLSTDFRIPCLYHRWKH
jgi:hypothetical protein